MNLLELMEEVKQDDVINIKIKQGIVTTGVNGVVYDRGNLYVLELDTYRNEYYTDLSKELTLKELATAEYTIVGTKRR